jgi:hypothetical protein
LRRKRSEQKPKGICKLYGNKDFWTRLRALADLPRSKDKPLWKYGLNNTMML